MDSQTIVIYALLCAYFAQDFRFFSVRLRNHFANNRPDVEQVYLTNNG